MRGLEGDEHEVGTHRHRRRDRRVACDDGIRRQRRARADIHAPGGRRGPARAASRRLAGDPAHAPDAADAEDGPVPRELELPRVGVTGARDPDHPAARKRDARHPDGRRRLRGSRQGAGRLDRQLRAARHERGRRPELLRRRSSTPSSRSSRRRALSSTGRSTPTRCGRASAAAARRTTTATPTVMLRPARQPVGRSRQFSIATHAVPPVRRRLDDARSAGAYYRYSFSYGTSFPTTRSSASGRMPTT